MFLLNTKKILILSGIIPFFLGYNYSIFASSEFLPHAQTLAQRGVINTQVSEEGYRLPHTLSRAEGIKMALLSAGLEQRDCRILSDFSFSDVSSSLGSLCGYIEGAIGNNIIVKSQRFYPNIPITRGDFADIIVKSFDALSLNFIGASSAGVVYYTDVSLDSLITANSINRLATTGCLNLKNTSFRPYASITRGEAFKIMACLVGKKNIENSNQGSGNGNQNGTQSTGNNNGIGSSNQGGQNTNNTTGTNTNGTNTGMNTTTTTTGNTNTANTNNSTNSNTTNTNSTSSTNNTNTNTPSNTTSSVSSSSSYVWSNGSYGSCTKTCGGGIQIRAVSCKKTIDNSIVSDSYCISTGITKPVIQQGCNTQVCTVGGGGTTGTTGMSTSNNANTSSIVSTPGIPGFPWVIEGVSFKSLEEVRVVYKTPCIHINHIYSAIGFGPCVTGTSTNITQRTTNIPQEEVCGPTPANTTIKEFTSFNFPGTAPTRTGKIEYGQTFAFSFVASSSVFGATGGIRITTNEYPEVGADNKIDYAFSRCPGVFVSNQPKCILLRKKWTSDYLTFPDNEFSSSGGCVIIPGQKYYLNIRPTEGWGMPAARILGTNRI